MARMRAPLPETGATISLRAATTSTPPKAGDTVEPVRSHAMRGTQQHGAVERRHVQGAHPFRRCEQGLAQQTCRSEICCRGVRCRTASCRCGPRCRAGSARRSRGCLRASGRAIVRAAAAFRGSVDSRQCATSRRSTELSRNGKALSSTSAETTLPTDGQMRAPWCAGISAAARSASPRSALR